MQIAGITRGIITGTSKKNSSNNLLINNSRVLILVTLRDRHIVVTLPKTQLGDIKAIGLEVFAELYMGSVLVLFQHQMDNGKRTAMSSASMPSWLRGRMKKNVIIALRTARPTRYDVRT